MSKKDIFRNQSKSMRNHNITTSATSCKPEGISHFLYSLYLYYGEEKKASNRRNMINVPPLPPHRYNPHMQIQTPAVNPQAKFQISPQEASDLANIPSSRNYQQEERNKAPTSN